MTLWVQLLITHFALSPVSFLDIKEWLDWGKSTNEKCNSGYFLVLKIKSTSEESCFLHLRDSLRNFCDLLSAFTRLRGNTVIHFVIIKQHYLNASQTVPVSSQPDSALSADNWRLTVVDCCTWSADVTAPITMRTSSGEDPMKYLMMGENQPMCD